MIRCSCRMQEGQIQADQIPVLEPRRDIPSSRI